MLPARHSPVSTNEEEEDDEKQWSSCCFKCHVQAVVFFSQLFISLVVIFFCITQLYLYNDCDTNQLYTGILTLVLGTWLPQPSFK